MNFIEPRGTSLTVWEPVWAHVSGLTQPITATGEVNQVTAAGFSQCSLLCLVLICQATEIKPYHTDLQVHTLLQLIHLRFHMVGIYHTVCGTLRQLPPPFFCFSSLSLCGHIFYMKTCGLSGQAVIYCQLHCPTSDFVARLRWKVLKNIL